MHVNVVLNKTAKSLGIISKVRHLVPQQTAIMLYMTLVEPYFNYCSLVWGSLNASCIIDNLLKVQKRYCRLITFSSYREHSKGLFAHLNILTVYSIYKRQLAVYMYKLTNNLLPNNDIFHFQQNSALHSHNTRSKLKLHIEYSRTKMRQDTVRFQGPKLWNSLPLNLRNCFPLTRSKHEIRKFISEQQCI